MGIVQEQRLALGANAKSTPRLPLNIDIAGVWEDEANLASRADFDKYLTIEVRQRWSNQNSAALGTGVTILVG
jgi:hypothetical protein